MKRLLLQRAGLGLLTLLGVSVLIFAGTEILPGDLASAILQNNATPEALAQIRQELGLNEPSWLRYFHWLLGALQGDFGHSLANQRAVAQEILPRFGNTLFLASYAALIAVPLALALGVLAVMFENTPFDRIINMVALGAISIPDYLLAYLLIQVFALSAGWFPSLANVTPQTDFLARLTLTFLPMLTLVLVILAHMMRMTRASLLAVMSSSYVEMATLKGLSPMRIVLFHAFPNTIGPIVNVIALNLAYLMVGVVVVETVFVYPGLGQLMVDAVAKHDVPVVQACGLIFATVFIMLNLGADIVAIWSNPRLRHARA